MTIFTGMMNLGLRGSAFQKYLESQYISWPKNKLGRLDLRRETFIQMGDFYPQIQPFNKVLEIHESLESAVDAFAS